MRILHLTDRLSQRGGADWHLLGVVGALAPDHEARLGVGRDDRSTAPPCEVAHVHNLDASKAAPVAGALDRLVESFRPEVIHIHNVVNPEALAWGSDRGAIMTVQDHRSFCPGRGKLTRQDQICDDPMEEGRCTSCFTDLGYFQRIWKTTSDRLAAVRRMRALVVLSHYMKRQLVAVGVPQAAIHVIPPFVHGLCRNAAPNGPPCVLFAGRLAAPKGVHDAVTAWRLSGVDLPLVFAGTGPERARLEAHGCEVLGWVPHQALSPVLARAQVLLMPSRWQEPFGIAGLEALWMGVPVAAFKSGGIHEWHSGRGLVRWGDVPGLAAALAQLLGHRAHPALGFEGAELMTRLLTLYRELA